ncbi:MAG: hypothetical protein JAY67_22360, partial [Candidatus Thiodiazotropha taylori]|nr:hypothetical protein [Candidatus Thiodiazotropha taylori]
NKIRPLHFELWMAEDGINYWFPVIASVYDEAKALRQARSLISESRSAKSWLAEFDVQVYRTVDLKGVGVFAITIGGYMAKDEVGQRVNIARKNGFPDAYSWESRFWGQNLLNDAPADARR